MQIFSWHFFQLLHVRRSIEQFEKIVLGRRLIAVVKAVVEFDRISSLFPWTLRDTEKGIRMPLISRQLRVGQRARGDYVLALLRPVEANALLFRRSHDPVYQCCDNVTTFAVWDVVVLAD